MGIQASRTNIRKPFTYRPRTLLTLRIKKIKMQSFKERNQSNIVRHIALKDEDGKRK